MDKTETQVVQPRRTLSRLLRRQLLVILVCVALGGAAGFLIMSAQSKRYSATATVLVTATGVQSDVVQANARTSDVINMDTEAQLVRSAAVAARAKLLDPALRSTQIPQIVKNVTVSVPANTTVLKITYSAHTARQAQQGANAFATAYLADRDATARAVLSKQVTNAQGRVASLTARLKAVSDAEAALPTNSPLRLFDSQQRRLYASEITALNQQLVNSAATQITPGRLLTSASLPSSPSAPSPALDVGSGLAAGLLLGLLVAWLRTKHRRTVRSVDDLAYQLDLPTLAVVEGRPNSDPQDAADHAPHRRDGETYRRLALLVSAAVPHPALIVVSSAGGVRSDRPIARNLAVTLSRAGASVRLLDVGVGSEGLRLDGPVELDSIERAEDLAQGRGGASIKESLERLRRDREYVIVSAASPTTAADALIFAALADAVLLVVETGARAKAVRGSLAELDAVSAPMLGIVLARRSRLRAALARRSGRVDVRPARSITPRVQPETETPAKPTGAASGAGGRQP